MRWNALDGVFFKRNTCTSHWIACAFGKSFVQSMRVESLPFGRWSSSSSSPSLLAFARWPNQFSNDLKTRCSIYVSGYQLCRYFKSWNNFFLGNNFVNVTPRVQKNLIINKICWKLTSSIRRLIHTHNVNRCTEWGVCEWRRLCITDSNVCVRTLFFRFAFLKTTNQFSIYLSINLQRSITEWPEVVFSFFFSKERERVKKGLILRQNSGNKIRRFLIW